MSPVVVSTSTRSHAFSIQFGPTRGAGRALVTPGAPGRANTTRAPSAGTSWASTVALSPPARGTRTSALRVQVSGLNTTTGTVPRTAPRVSSRAARSPTPRRVSVSSVAQALSYHWSATT